MSITQAAKYMNLSRKRINEFCNQGRFKGAEKVGSYWIIPEKAIKTFIRQPAGAKPKPKIKEFLTDVLQKNETSKELIKGDLTNAN